MLLTFNSPQRIYIIIDLRESPWKISHPIKQTVNDQFQRTWNHLIPTITRITLVTLSIELSPKSNRARVNY